MFYASILTYIHIIVASLLNGMYGFLCDFMIAPWNFMSFISLSSLLFSETYERTSDLNDDYDAGGKPRKLGLK